MEIISTFNDPRNPTCSHISREFDDQQKQPPRGVLGKRCSENMQQIYGRTLMSKCEITLRHECSPVNLLHIFRTPITKNASGRLLLDQVWELQTAVSVKHCDFLTFLISTAADCRITWKIKKLALARHLINYLFFFLFTYLIESVRKKIVKRKFWKRQLSDKKVEYFRTVTKSKKLTLCKLE